MRASSLPLSARRGGVVALLATMLLLASCGSSGSTASSTTAKPADATTTVAGSEDVTTTAAVDGPGGIDASNSEFCANAKDWAKSSERSDGQSQEEIDAAFGAFIKKMVETAPAELKDDVNTVSTAIVRGDTTTSAEVTAANKNIQTYIKDVCGVDMPAS